MNRTDKISRRDLIGFDDRYFMLVGIPILGLITNYLFNSSFENYIYFLISYGISIFFTIINWVSMREMMIFLRRKYPSVQNFFQRSVIFLFIIIAIVLVANQLGNLLLTSMLGGQFNGPGVTGLIIILLISIMTMAIYEAIYHFNQFKQVILKEEQYKQVAIQSKMDALQNQARPHFLFNSLNTLRDIVEYDPKQSAIDFVDKLADVYRFILDTSDTSIVTLEQEINFAKAYLHIQQERFDKNLKVEWNLDIDKSGSMTILPMSLQLLMENAIKHNIVSKSRPLSIQIEIKDSTIVVTNNYQPKSSKIPSTGLGLKNIEQRYALLGDRLPIVEQTEDTFSVQIPLNIDR